MQDSLCGSMAPLNPRPSSNFSSKDYFPSLPPDHSHMQQTDDSDMRPDLSYLDSKSSSTTTMSGAATTSVVASSAAASLVAPVAAPPSPDSPNLSSWIDMLDELIEPLDDPMMFSPSRDSTTSEFTPSYSSLSDNFMERQHHHQQQQQQQNQQQQQQQDRVSSPSLSATSQQYESPQQEVKQDPFPLLFPKLESYARLPSQQPNGSSHVPQYLPSQMPPQRPATSRISSSSKLPYQSVSTSLHKVPSAPQLCVRSPRRHSLAPFSPPPAINPCSSPQSMPHSTHRTTSIQSDLSRFPRRSSLVEVSGSVSPSSYSNSPPNLPNSLPSMGYLSNRMNQQMMVPPVQRRGSFSGMPAGASGRRELLAGLQQRQPVGMAQSMSSSGRVPPENQDTGLRLVHLLLACAEAVAREDYFGAREIILELQQIISSNGDSMQRVAAYFTDALHSRLTGNGNRSYMALRSYDPASAEEVLAAYQILYQACPYVKFAHFTSNQAIFEAFEGEEKVHIVDLDIIQGYQWPAFMQALAARPGGAPHLRITGVGMPLEAVQETGKRLAELAESLHVPFEFHAVGERLENLKAYMLERRVGEALAVNSVYRLHRLLSDSLNQLIGILHMIREQAPNIFTLVEQEASHNGPFFLGRFLEALHYYSAIFDSLDATLPQTSPERTKVEQLVFSIEITNIVACEGSERLERHEKLEKWRKIMEGIGFQNVALSANAVNQSKLLLGLYPCDGYTLVEDRGSLLLGWQDRPVIAASAWRC